LKPGENSCQGIGIEMGYSLSDIEKYIENFFGLDNRKEYSTPHDTYPSPSKLPQQNLSIDKNKIKIKKKYHSNYLLIQKYLKDPLLFDNRKFDLRCYVLVVRTPLCFRAYWYRYGYARTSSYKYQLGSD
jgi:Tubulin-tyrosine ligase family